MEHCPYATHPSGVSSFLICLNGYIHVNSSGLRASDCYVDVFVGWQQHKVGILVVLFLVAVFGGMIQLVDKM